MKMIRITLILLIIIFGPLLFIPIEKCFYNKPYPEVKYKRCGSTGLSPGEACYVKVNEPFIFNEAKSDINPKCFWRKVFIWHPIYLPEKFGGFWINEISYDKTAFKTEKFIITHNCELHHYIKFIPLKKGKFKIKTKGSHDIEYNIIVE